MSYFYYLFLLLISTQAFSLQWYEKIGLLRFGNEISVISESGIVDLKHLTKEMYYNVEGEVLFFPEVYIEPQFYSPNDFHSLIDKYQPIKVDIWKKASPTSISTTEATRGTFILKFKNVPRFLLAIDLVREFHPYTAYIAQKNTINKILSDGDLFAKANEVRNESNLFKPTPTIMPESDMFLIIHANSRLYNGRNSLTFSSVYIGEQKYLIRQIKQSRYFLHVISGGFLITALIYSFIFMFRPKDNSSLYLALYSLSAFTLSLLYTSTFHLNLQVLLDIFTIINLASICCLQHYLVDKVKLIIRQISQKLLFLVFKISFLVGSFSVGLKLYDLAGMIFLFGFITTFSQIIFTIFVGFKYKKAGIHFLALGTLLNALFQLPIFINYIGTSNNETGYYVLIANFCMVICLALVNAKEFATTYKESLRLSKELNKEVEKQTSKLQLQKESLERQKSEIEKANDALKIADEQKTSFFQNISHELRTPLTLILASVGSLQKKSKNDKDIEVADRNSKRLLRLVNQLLDFQKITHTDQSLDLKTINLSEFIFHCGEYFEKPCNDRGIQFHCSVDDQNHSVLAQVDALEKIIFNYLSNALKYTPKGGIISLSLLTKGRFVRVKVTDNGPGIDEKGLARIFKVFSQVDESDRRAHEGTGLGLALVKQLAEKMSGRVGVDTVVGQGSTFWVEFPSLNSETVEVLLVDSDFKVRVDLEKLVKDRTGIRSFRAIGSAEEALPILDEFKVNCVLSDSNLPGMDGAEFLQKVATSQKDVKRILISSRNESHRIVQKAINIAKVDKVFYKPLGNELVSIIESLAILERPDRPIRSILLVDDDPKILHSLVSFLMNNSLVDDISTASSFDEAKRHILDSKYKIIVTDANLGQKESGADLLSLASKTCPETYRMMVTGERGSDILNEALKSGQIQHIMYKPVKNEDFCSKVVEAINLSPLREQSLQSESVQIKDWHLSESGLEESTGEVLEPSEYKGDVVVCDDVIDMRNLMIRCLREVGFRVIPCRNGKEGLQTIKEKKPDLVVTDWMMPEMTGPEMIKAMHEDDELSTIPSILLTAKTDDESKMLGSHVGATAYLAKPFDELELQTTARNLVDLKKGEKRIEELNRYLTEQVLSRFLPPKLVSQVVNGQLTIDESPKMMPVTILFCDICGFTQISEDVGPKRISEILNSFLQEMSQIIFDHDGTIDKFIGDSIMAIFGAPEASPPEIQVKNATNCGMALQEKLNELNQKWGNDDLFRLRVGIHHGPAVVGQFGSELRSEYTAIGPTVNFASRIENSAKPGEVLLSSNVRDYMEEGWEAAGTFDLKGIGHVKLFKMSKAHLDESVA